MYQRHIRHPAILLERRRNKALYVPTQIELSHTHLSILHTTGIGAHVVLPQSLFVRAIRYRVRSFSFATLEELLSRCVLWLAL